ncbi:MAG: hypothetical protein U0231_16650 [Nitrospiraceae bacterium]
MKLSGLAAAIVALLLVPLTSWAMPPVESTVEYSADSVMETEGGMTVKSRLYQAPGKQRMEMGGAEGVTIIRKDKQESWQLIGDMYMEMPFDQSKSSGGSRRFDIPKQTGRPSHQRHEDDEDEGDCSQEGWVEVRRILLDDERGSRRQDRYALEGGRSKGTVALELSNVKIEKQDPALFNPTRAHEK